MRPSVAENGLLSALRDAEDALRALPQTGTVRELQTRLIALKSVVAGVALERPKLTESQQAKLQNDVLVLARDVADLRRRLAPPEE